MNTENILNKIYSKYSFVVGVDEVGRGCLAGPVVSCAIIMDRNKLIEGVTDSKKLSKKKRELLYNQIIENSVSYGIGIVDNEVIDKINIKNASKLAMKLAVENMKDKNSNLFSGDFVVTDAEKIDVFLEQLNLIKGDELCYEVSCASIIAKEYRDAMFIDFDKKFPGYNFKKNIGYGTKEHYKGLDKNGITPIHRLTFLKKYFEKKNEK